MRQKQTHTLSYKKRSSLLRLCWALWARAGREGCERTREERHGVCERETMRGAVVCANRRNKISRHASAAMRTSLPRVVEHLRLFLILHLLVEPRLLISIRLRRRPRRRHLAVEPGLLLGRRLHQCVLTVRVKDEERHSSGEYGSCAGLGRGRHYCNDISTSANLRSTWPRVTRVMALIPKKARGLE